MLLHTSLLCFLPFVYASPTGPPGGGGGHSGYGGGGLPQVDLGYENHQAISFNETGQTYNFSNIRFALPPVGDLRFAAPVAPTGRDPQVQNGSTPRICPQASPAWTYIAGLFVRSLLAGNASQFNYTQAEEQLQASLAAGGGSAAATPAPGITEDCLFLDVHVPKAVFDSARKNRGGGAPVLVWIYGGGYTFGQKAGSFNPSGLIKASQRDGSPGIVYVAMNYRLGALGWLSGSTLQGSGGVSNAGLYDQRLALEWVQNNIHLFGGDPNRVTVMGESAGGGSIEHQLTAYGGREPVPFQQVIPQSPGFLPVTSQYIQEDITQSFLDLLNVSSIAEARQLPSSAVILANILQVGASRYSSFTYGPVADGIFAPTVPSLLLNAGAHAKNISVLVGHNTNEAPSFTPPFIQSDDQLRAYIQTSYPGIPASSLTYILEVLYPPIYDGTYPYTSPLTRLFLLIAESIFTCNTNFINRAYSNKTYAYEFAVPPALHGFDVMYTFYNGQGTNATQGLFAPVAEVHQAYITNFVKYGNPNGMGVPVFPMQGMNASMNVLNVTGVEIRRDNTVNERCAWWGKGLLS